MRQNFGQFHVVWASLPRKILRTLDKKNCLKVRSLEVTTIWTEIAVQFECRPFFFGGHHILDRNSGSI